MASAGLPAGALCMYGSMQNVYRTAYEKEED